MFKYDQENRLVEKRVRVEFTTCPDPASNGGYSGALLARLDYDPLGRLYKIGDGSSNTTEFVHDGNALVAEYTPNGTIADRYTHGSNVEADDPLVWYEGASTTSTYRRNLYADERGSIAFVSDDAGTKVTVNTFDEYGINGAANDGRFQYTGQAWLEEAELYYYKARIYSPKLGRFLQVDPIGYEDQFNLYAYVGNDPINKSDPSGLDAAEIGKQFYFFYFLFPEYQKELASIRNLDARVAFAAKAARNFDTIYNIPQRATTDDEISSRPSIARDPDRIRFSDLPPEK